MSLSAKNGSFVDHLICFGRPKTDVAKWLQWRSFWGDECVEIISGFTVNTNIISMILLLILESLLKNV